MKFRALREARWILGLLAACWVATFALFPLLSLVVAGMMLFSLYFFRDPEREPPADDSLAVSPADGVVAEILYAPGDQVPEGAVVLRLKAATG